MKFAQESGFREESGLGCRGIEDLRTGESYRLDHLGGTGDDKSRLQDFFKEWQPKLAAEVCNGFIFDGNSEDVEPRKGQAVEGGIPGKGEEVMLLDMITLPTEGNSGFDGNAKGPVSRWRISGLCNLAVEVALRDTNVTRDDLLHVSSEGAAVELTKFEVPAARGLAVGVEVLEAVAKIKRIGVGGRAFCQRIANS